MNEVGCTTGQNEQAKQKNNPGKGHVLSPPDKYYQEQLKTIFGKDLFEVREHTPAYNKDNVIILPLLAGIPAGLPDYSEKDIESFAQVPRYLFPGADFIIHCCVNSIEPEIEKGSFCVIRKETEPLNHHLMLVKTGDGFTITRIPHKIIRSKELKIIGEVIGTWNRIKPK